MLTTVRSARLISCVLLFAASAISQPTPTAGVAVCVAEPVIGKSRSGLIQVSNLQPIAVTCKIPARRLPKSGLQHGVRVDAKVYLLPTGGVRKLVPSTVNCCGGAGDANFERDSFDLDIPIDASERDAAIKAYYSEVAQFAASSSDPKEREKAQLVQKIMPQALVPYFRQNRVGRFQVDCKVLDEGKVIATGRADFEVVFKGNFFDQPQFQAGKKE